MEILKTKCPVCEWTLEFPRDFDNVTCGICGSAFQVREYKGNLNLSLLGEDRLSSAALDEASTLALIDARVKELDEDVEKVAEEIEVLRSNEQVAPLQIGCAVFGLFGSLLLVLAFFATIGKTYFGGWWFYLSLAGVLLLSALRLRKKLTRRDKLEYFRQERVKLKEALTALENERLRLQRIKEGICGDPVETED
jgi:hypothetical protein